MSFRSYLTPKGNLRVKRVLHGGAFLQGRSTPKPCSGDLNHGHLTPNDIVDRINRGKERKKARDEARRKAAVAYLNAEQEFQLWRGETAFGKPKTMTGREVRDLNKGFERKFMDTTDPNARLWRWLPAGITPAPRGTTMAQRRKFVYDKSVPA